MKGKREPGVRLSGAAWENRLPREMTAAEAQMVRRALVYAEAREQALGREEQGPRTERELGYRAEVQSTFRASKSS